MIYALGIGFVLLMSIALMVARNLVKKGRSRKKARLLFAVLSGLSFELMLELGDLVYKVNVESLDKIVLMVLISLVCYFGSYGVYNIRLQRRIDLLEPVDKKDLFEELKKNKNELYTALAVTLIPLLTIGTIFLLLELLS